MRFCVLLALAVQCFTQETQEMNIPEGHVDAQTASAIEAEMLARLTPEQKKQHEDFMAENKKRVLDKWFMKAGLFDPSAPAPLLPMVRLASDACRFVVAGGECHAYNAEGEHLRLVEGHANEHHKGDTKASQHKFCSKVDSLLKTVVAKKDYTALSKDKTEAAAFCDDFFAHGTGEGYLGIKLHFLDNKDEAVKNEL